MTDKELQRLSRADLIEIIYRLQQSEKALQEENEVLRQKLKDKRIAIEQSGSLAEVLAKLSGLFEAAQATADGYLEKAEQLLEEAKQTRAQADEYQAAIKQQAAKRASVTMQQLKDMLAKTEEECRQIGEAAQTEQRTPQQGGISVL